MVLKSKRLTYLHGIFFALFCLIVFQTVIHLGARSPHYYCSLPIYRGIQLPNNPGAGGTIGYFGVVDERVVPWEGTHFAALSYLLEGKEIFVAGKESDNINEYLYPLEPAIPSMIMRIVVRSPYSFFVAVLEPFFGLYIGGVLISVIAWFGAAYLTYLTALELKLDVLEAIFSAFLVGTGPGFINLVGDLQPHCLQFLFVALIIFLSCRWKIFYPQTRLSHLVIFALVMGISFLVYKAFIFFVFFIVLGSLSRIQFWKIILICLTSIGVYFLWDILMNCSIKISYGNITSAKESTTYAKDYWQGILNNCSIDELTSGLLIMTYCTVSSTFFSVLIVPAVFAFFGYNISGEHRGLINAYLLAVFLFMPVWLTAQTAPRYLFCVYPVLYILASSGIFYFGSWVSDWRFFCGKYSLCIKYGVIVLTFLVIFVISNADFLFNIYGPFAFYNYPKWNPYVPVW